VLLEAIEDAGFEGELMQEADSNCLTLQIEGMTCSSCSSAVESALRSQKGVVSAAVNLLAGRAEVCTLRFSPCWPQPHTAEHASVCTTSVTFVCRMADNSIMRWVVLCAIKSCIKLVVYQTSITVQ
jgi:copper chaperone CopZ